MIGAYEIQAEKLWLRIMALRMGTERKEYSLYFPLAQDNLVLSRVSYFQPYEML